VLLITESDSDGYFNINLSNKTANIFIIISIAQNDALSYLSLDKDITIIITQRIVAIITYIGIIIVINININKKKI
jgi:hypothetical protein